MDFTPQNLHLPAKFASWHEHQYETICELLDSTARIKVLSAPTGSGKTLIATAYALAMANRFAYVTHSNNLLDQYESDFGPMVCALKGRANYSCISAHTASQTCEGAPCLDGFECYHRFNDCAYDVAEAAARKSPWGFVTNYAKWLSMVYNYQGNRAYDNRLGSIDLLVLDECHKIDDWLTKYTSIDLHGPTVDTFLGTPIPDTRSCDSTFLQLWATEALKLAKEAYREASHSVESADTLREIESLGKQLSRLAMPDIQWIIDRSLQSSLQARPLWPDRFIESYLLMSVPNVLLCSATITEPRIKKLGIRDYSYHRMPSTFPPERRKFIYLDLEPPVKMTHRMSSADKAEIFNRLSLGLSKYADCNQIVYTVSHARTRETWANTNIESQTTSLIIDDLDEFITRGESHPCILLSASIVEGVDFKDAKARIGHLIKVPYPSLGDELIKARMQADQEYYTLLAAEQVTQFAGRLMRHKLDWGYIICYDYKIVDLLNDAFFEPWFLDSVVYPFTDQLPEVLQ